MERAIKFYDAVFGVLVVSRQRNWSDGWAGWGGSYDEAYGFWVCSPFNGRAPAAGNGTMTAFRAKDEIQVQDFHAAALECGGTDEGAPGTRPYYEPSFFVAYVRDPDGNKLACVYHEHKPQREVREYEGSGPFPHLSGSIVPKQIVLSVDVTARPNT